MSKTEKAVSCFKEGFLCSQAMVSIYGPELGLDRDTALRLSAAFGGGTARMGETCGAVSGAIMVIGLKYGHCEAKDEQAREKTYSLVREFVDRFKSVNGSITCRELLDCDINTPEGLQLAREKRLFSTVCPKYVQNAAEILEQLL
ncbi:C-GCAxxG-C-C family protein [Desulforudis sp. 1088]|uniref:C-GCAxxG-C-C family protein n=1 Tax=unclassified Candidatus Desulforudis TaxID=2635950 RepID=UPI003CE4DF40